MDAMRDYFQSSIKLPRSKSRVRIPCPALNLNNLGGRFCGLFNFRPLLAARFFFAPGIDTRFAGGQLFATKLTNG
jgi:hypothetical protein